MQRISYFFALWLSFLSMPLIPADLPAASHRIQGRKSAVTHRHQWRGNRSYGYPGRLRGRPLYPSRWPSYYAYYRYPIAGSIYYYSYPTNSNFFYSYPSYSTDWTYPSYPYVGKYYVNDAPHNATRRLPTRRYVPPPSATLQDHPQRTSKTSVFING